MGPPLSPQPTSTNAEACSAFRGRLQGLYLAAALLPVVGGAAAVVLLWPEAAAAGFSTSYLAAAGAAVVALLLQGYILQRLHRRTNALAMIDTALTQLADGEPDPGSLQITADNTPAATRWNHLIQRLSQARETQLDQQIDAGLSRDAAPRHGRDATLDALPHGVFIIDQEQRVSLANGAACRIFGRSHERLIHAPLPQILSDQNVLGVVERVLHRQDDRGGTVELQMGGDDEAPAIMRATVRRRGKTHPRQAVIVFEDVTQQRTADTSRNLFVAQATHELRTPLTNIGLYLERAIDLDDHETADRAECLNVINSEVLRLGRVVEEVLSVSQIEAGSLQVSRDDVRLDELIEQLEHEYRPQAVDQQVTLKFELPPKLPVLQGDRQKITLALHNLLGNAIKYTPAGGSVRVAVEDHEQELRVAVSDTGIGIAPDDLKRVFDKFYRADDQRLRDITGSGLGLALAREVVRLHGGDIVAESTLNQGSTFTLRLPLTTAAAG